LQPDFGSPAGLLLQKVIWFTAGAKLLCYPLRSRKSKNEELIAQRLPSSMVHEGK
jgi:hypothetical protein